MSAGRLVAAAIRVEEQERHVIGAGLVARRVDDLLDQVVELDRSHERAREFVQRNERAQARVLPAQAFLLQRADDRRDQLLWHKGLDDKADKSGAERLHRHFPGTKAGNHDPGHFRVVGLDALKRLNPGAIGQKDVGDDDVEGFTLRQRQCLGAIRGDFDRVAGVDEHAARLLAQFVMVFENEKAFVGHNRL
jgi:hypothetical protein